MPSNTPMIYSATSKVSNKPKLPSQSHTTAMSSTPMYEIKDIPGKGRGLKASRAITRGERILFESPLFTFPNISHARPTISVIEPKVYALEPIQRQAFFTLHNNFSYSGTPKALGIIVTNALHVNANLDAIFPTFSLINHACVPNACYSWNDNLKKGTLHSIRAIAADEEITMTYGDHRRGSAGRFVCICELCTSANAAALLESDTRREEMLVIEDQITRHQEGDPENLFIQCREMQTLMSVEYERCPTPALASLYEMAAGIAATHSDGGRTVGFAAWAYRVRLICEGLDSQETQRCRAWMEDPKSHPKWGRTDFWGMQLERPPMGLSEGEYENWLWRWSR